MGSNDAATQSTAASQSDNEPQLVEEVRRLRAELAQHEKMLTTLSESTSELFWRTDAEHRFTYMSTGVTKIVETQLDHQLGQTRAELACDDLESGRWQRHLADLEHRRPFWGFRYTRKNTSGDVRQVSTTGKPVFSDDGTFEGYIGVARDITDDLAAEERAQTAEANLFAAINELDAIFVMWGADERLIVCNEHFRTINQSTLEYCTPGVKYEDHLRAIVATGAIEDANDDPESWIAERLARHRNPKGTFELSRDARTYLINEARLADGSIIMMMFDITDRKCTEQALRASETRLRDFGSVAADWFWETDAEHRVVYATTEGDLLSGNDLDADRQAQDTSFLRLFAEQLQRNLDMVVDPQPFHDVRFSRTLKPGIRIHLSLSGKPTFDHNGIFTGYRGVGRDVSQLIEAEEALRIERDRAEQANRAKSEFLAHMSHELRTPLNAILGFSDIIRNELLGEILNSSYITYAEDINASGQHLLSLINDLLDISRIESGRFEIFPDTVDIGEILDQSEKLFAQRLKYRGLTLNIALEENATSLLVDRRAFSQVMLNLLSNAEKFNRDGGDITVTSTVRQVDGGIDIVVADTGHGFDVSDVETVFEPFARIVNPLTKAIPGTGLGLPIVKALMDLHAGHVVIESTRGEGTTVTLSFPPSSKD